MHDDSARRELFRLWTAGVKIRKSKRWPVSGEEDAAFSQPVQGRGNEDRLLDDSLLLLSGSR
ncbi:hypothetical protein CFII68_06604 [Pseudomonas sp. CFII68]|nr:hypothetical protein CFII68_06604 [Pseudomonas sp. CFII68]